MGPSLEVTILTVNPHNQHILQNIIKAVACFNTGVCHPVLGAVKNHFLNDILISNAMKT